MGTEYRISTSGLSLPRLAEFLRRTGGQPCPTYPEQIEFRLGSDSAGQMPDATVIVEATGFYFCDHGGSRERVATLFRRLLDEALTLSGSPEQVVVTRL